MGYIDFETLLSDSQAVTADAVSTNAYDTGAASGEGDIGSGEPMCIEFNVEVAADATTGDETYTFQVIESAASNLGSATVLASRTIAASLLTAGYTFALVIPPTSLRYVGANYDVGGTTPSVTVSANIKPLSMVDQRAVHPDGITIS